MSAGSNKEEYEKLRLALEKEFSIKISFFEKIEVGYSNAVFDAKIDGKPAIVRLNNGKSAYPMEVFVFKELAKRGLPVPKVYYYKENPKNLENPVMILQKFTDSALWEVEPNSTVEETIYEKAGKVLKKLHEYKIEGFGSLTLDGDTLKGRYSTSKESWAAQIKKHDMYSYLEYLKTNELVDEDAYKLVLQCVRDISKLQIDEAVFVHGDYHQVHIFTDFKEITGIIDISAGFAGDPRHDIAYTLVFLNERQRKAFLRGYNIEFPDEVILKYMIFIAAHKIRWRHKKGMLDGVEDAQKVLGNTIELYTNLSS